MPAGIPDFHAKLIRSVDDGDTTSSSVQPLSIEDAVKGFSGR